MMESNMSPESVRRAYIKAEQDIMTSRLAQLREEQNVKQSEMANFTQSSVSKEEDKMRDHYDFSNGIKNPYADRLKKQITIRLDDQVIEYFKKMAEETGMPYQNIINYYLLDCVKEKKHLEVAFSK